jgi:hypothetical protein
MRITRVSIIGRTARVELYLDMGWVGEAKIHRVFH